jgi:hypothetical protein
MNLIKELFVGVGIMTLLLIILLIATLTVLRKNR